MSRSSGHSGASSSTARLHAGAGDSLSELMASGAPIDALRGAPLCGSDLKTLLRAPEPDGVWPDGVRVLEPVGLLNPVFSDGGLAAEQYLLYGQVRLVIDLMRLLPPEQRKPTAIYVPVERSAGHYVMARFLVDYVEDKDIWAINLAVKDPRFAPGRGEEDRGQYDQEMAAHFQNVLIHLLLAANPRIKAIITSRREQFLERCFQFSYAGDQYPVDGQLVTCGDWVARYILQAVGMRGHPLTAVRLSGGAADDAILRQASIFAIARTTASGVNPEDERVPWVLNASEQGALQRNRGENVSEADEETLPERADSPAPEIESGVESESEPESVISEGSVEETPPRDVAGEEVSPRSVTPDSVTSAHSAATTVSSTTSSRTGSMRSIGSTGSTSSSTSLYDALSWARRRVVDAYVDEARGGLEQGAFELLSGGSAQDTQKTFDGQLAEQLSDQYRAHPNVMAADEPSLLSAAVREVLASNRSYVRLFADHAPTALHRRRDAARTGSFARTCHEEAREETPSSTGPRPRTGTA